MWPWLPNLNGPIPTYYLIISLSFTLSILWIFKRAKKQGFDLNLTADLLLTLMLAGFIGARLFQVVYENPTFYLTNPLSIFKFWQGGFVYYGGFIGAVIAAFVFYKLKPFNFYKFTDIIAIPLSFGYGLGRLGCFFAGCCYGRETNLPWAITFPAWSESPSQIPLHPTQIYFFLWEMLSLLVLMIIENRATKFFKNPGSLFGMWLILHGLGRAIIEQFRGDFRGANVFNLSISTWISFMVIATGVLILARRKNVSTFA
ncbi:MAG: prolipoprotein diacylglyceryl transferase [Oligoflexia bacterium]|nr:prolipoprotein diacylglyceryl transferase [Oligoflexia bacterium]